MRRVIRINRSLAPFMGPRASPEHNHLGLLLRCRIVGQTSGRRSGAGPAAIMYRINNKRGPVGRQSAPLHALDSSPSERDHQVAPPWASPAGRRIWVGGARESGGAVLDALLGLASASKQQVAAAGRHFPGAPLGPPRATSRWPGPHCARPSRVAVAGPGLDPGPPRAAPSALEEWPAIVAVVIIIIS